MKLKTIEVDGKTFAEVQDGKPVYIGDDGKEIAFDAPATITTINRITDESKGFKTRAQTAEDKLAKFEGIDDPVKARQALATVANLDDKKLVDAGEVEQVKAAAIASVEEKYKPVVEENERLKGDLYKERVGGAFARSKFIADKVAIPTEFVEARFGSAFKIEDGKTVAYGPDGNRLFSRSKHGEPADFEEALEMLIETSPHKDSILKASGAQGSGARQSEGRQGGQDVSGLSAVQKMNAGRQAASK